MARRVLILDDDKSVRHIVRRLLESESFEVVEAESIREASRYEVQSPGNHHEGNRKHFVYGGWESCVHHQGFEGTHMRVDPKKAVDGHKKG